MNPTIALVTKLFPRTGYFIECGAHDGVGDSNTYELEQLGWRGLCIEASNAFHGLRQSRKCSVDNRALWRTDGETIEFQEVSGEAIELSGIRQCFGDHWDRNARPHQIVPKLTVSLPTVLREHGAPSVIEFFCLDTEGSELEILHGHDFGAYKILTMLVEHNGVVKRADELAEFLVPLGYTLEPPPNSIESWFVHRELRS